MKKTIATLVLLLFLFQVAYLSYEVPQIILLGSSFPGEIKLSAVVAGLCVGVLYFLKAKSSPLDDNKSQHDETSE